MNEKYLLLFRIMKGVFDLMQDVQSDVGGKKQTIETKNIMGFISVQFLNLRLRMTRP